MNYTRKKIYNGEYKYVKIKKHMIYFNINTPHRDIINKYIRWDDEVNEMGFLIIKDNKIEYKIDYLKKGVFNYE